MNDRISRRSFVRLTGGALLGSALAGCTQRCVHQHTALHAADFHAARRFTRQRQRNSCRAASAIHADCAGWKAGSCSGPRSCPR